MSGLNFQTQTIINYNLDPDSKKELFGTICQKSGEAEKIINVRAAKEDSGGSTYGTKLGLGVLRDFRFYKDTNGIKAISLRKRAGYEGKMCKATLSAAFLTSLASGVSGKKYYRLDIYLGVQGAEPYIYSTPWVQKGIPLWVEFTVSQGDDAEKIAKNIANAIKKNNLFVYDKELLTVEVTGSTTTSTLVFTGTADYQRFKKIEVSTFDVDDEYAVKFAEIDDTNITINEVGENAFGTYSQIIKDLRLPTLANTHWTHIRQAETPIVGAIYNQYIITTQAPSTNDGMQAVGQRMDSVTTHVFWVRNDENLIYEWETAMSVLGDIKDEKDSTVSPSEP